MRTAPSPTEPDERTTRPAPIGAGRRRGSYCGRRWSADGAHRDAEPADLLADGPVAGDNVDL
jgi:hypothetical protein